MVYATGAPPASRISVVRSPNPCAAIRACVAAIRSGSCTTGSQSISPIGWSRPMNVCMSASAGSHSTGGTPGHDTTR